MSQAPTVSKRWTLGLSLVFISRLSLAALAAPSADTAQPISSSAGVQTSSANSEPADETATNSLVEFMDANFLANPTPPGPPGGAAHEPGSNAIDLAAEISKVAPSVAGGPSGGGAVKPISKSGARRGRGESVKKNKIADWWTELVAAKSRRLEKENTASELRRKSTTPPPVYREQPLSQNALLTARNQLAAIRSRHSLLTTRAVPQLQHLDQRLVDTYRLCFKRKMPLYAGMLYRTRDFVVRMANEVKHERRVLEAMAKQVQKVLRQRVANTTLVKDYNRQARAGESLQVAQQLAAAPDEPADSPVQLLPAAPKGGEPSAREPQLAQSPPPPPPPLIRIKSEQQDQSINDVAPQPLKRLNSLNPAARRRPAETPEPLAPTTMAASGPPRGAGELQGATKSPGARQIRYTVHINEVNLRKQLERARALADRINGSYYELMSVIDDITYLFKLSAAPRARPGKFRFEPQSANQFSMSAGLDSNELPASMFQVEQQRRLRKMFKSPIAVFLEKYGVPPTGNFENVYTAPAVGANNSDGSSSMRLVSGGPTFGPATATPSFTADTLAEMKPLFSAADLNKFDEDAEGATGASKPPPLAPQ